MLGAHVRATGALAGAARRAPSYAIRLGAAGAGAAPASLAAAAAASGAAVSGFMGGVAGAREPAAGVAPRGEPVLGACERGERAGAAVARAPVAERQPKRVRLEVFVLPDTHARFVGAASPLTNRRQRACSRAGRQGSSHPHGTAAPCIFLVS